MRMTLEDIQAAWSRDTSYWPDKWSPENRASGQCAVTALLVQDLVGGDIWRGWVDGQPHYWNRADGEPIDLTWEQFPGGSVRRIDVPVNRLILLSDEGTRRRYELLSERAASATASTTSASGNEQVAAEVVQPIREALNPSAQGADQ
jgi:hypothetical protein